MKTRRQGFFVPTVHAPGSALLLHCDGANNSTTITDSTGRHTVTAVGTAKLSTTQAKFGATSLALDGSGHISVPEHADFHPAGDFTVDFWVWLNNISTDYALMGKLTTSGFGLYVFMFHGSAGSGFAPFLENGYSTNGTSDAHSGVVSTPSPTNAWHHVAVVRTGNLYKMAWDGVFGDSFTSSSVLNTGAGEMGFGALIDANGGFVALPRLNGFMDEIRWTNFAAWTSDFTPPSAPYTN